MSAGGPVDPNYYYYYGEIFDDFMFENPEVQSSVVWSTQNGNSEEVNMFDVEPGIYYLTAFSYRKVTDFTIVAEFTYAPANADPSTAIELQPDIAYGPMSGYNSLDQYFFIEVPTGTERLEIDLDGGFGEATLHTRFETTPTASEADYHSGAPGAGDKIGFNNPTPGTWYILLDSESVFSGVSITASFEDLYVWEYDGTPIELFNDEEIDGLSAPAGERLFFYVNLESRSDEVTIDTYGGEGSLYITADGEVDYSDFFGFGEFDEKNSLMKISLKMNSTRTERVLNNHSTFIHPPQADSILSSSQRRIFNVSVVAAWTENSRPGPSPEPEPEPQDILSCDDGLDEFFGGANINGDGLLNGDEFRRSDAPEEITFNQIDSTEDGFIEYSEVVAHVCNCENELTFLMDQLPETTSVEVLSTLEFKNDIDVKSLDLGKIPSFPDLKLKKQYQPALPRTIRLTVMETESPTKTISFPTIQTSKQMVMVMELETMRILLQALPTMSSMVLVEVCTHRFDRFAGPVPPGWRW